MGPRGAGATVLDIAILLRAITRDVCERTGAEQAAASADAALRRPEISNKMQRGSLNASISDPAHRMLLENEEAATQVLNAGRRAMAPFLRNSAALAAAEKRAATKKTVYKGASSSLLESSSIDNSFDTTTTTAPATDIATETAPASTPPSASSPSPLTFRFVCDAVPPPPPLTDALGLWSSAAFGPTADVRAALSAPKIITPASWPAAFGGALAVFPRGAGAEGAAATAAYSAAGFSFAASLGPSASLWGGPVIGQGGAAVFALRLTTKTTTTMTMAAACTLPHSPLLLRAPAPLLSCFPEARAAIRAHTQPSEPPADAPFGAWVAAGSWTVASPLTAPGDAAAAFTASSSSSVCLWYWESAEAEGDSVDTTSTSAYREGGDCFRGGEADENEPLDPRERNRLVRLLRTLLVEQDKGSSIVMRSPPAVMVTLKSSVAKSPESSKVNQLAMATLSPAVEPEAVNSNILSPIKASVSAVAPLGAIAIATATDIAPIPPPPLTATARPWPLPPPRSHITNPSISRLDPFAIYYHSPPLPNACGEPIIAALPIVEHFARESALLDLLRGRVASAARAGTFLSLRASVAAADPSATGLIAGLTIPLVLSAAGVAIDALGAGELFALLIRCSGVEFAQRLQNGGGAHGKIADDSGSTASIATSPARATPQRNSAESSPAGDTSRLTSPASSAAGYADSTVTGICWGGGEGAGSGAGSLVPIVPYGAPDLLSIDALFLCDMLEAPAGAGRRTESAEVAATVAAIVRLRMRLCVTAAAAAASAAAAAWPDLPPPPADPDHQPARAVDAVTLRELAAAARPIGAAAAGELVRAGELEARGGGGGSVGVSPPSPLLGFRSPRVERRLRVYRGHLNPLVGLGGLRARKTGGASRSSRRPRSARICRFFSGRQRQLAVSFATRGGVA